MSHYKPGTKVKIKDTNEIVTVSYFDNNICGDNCCSGYLVKENRTYYTSDQLEFVAIRKPWYNRLITYLRSKDGK